MIIVLIIIGIDNDIRLLVLTASKQELCPGSRLLQWCLITLECIASVGDDRHVCAFIELLILIVLNEKVTHRPLSGVAALGPLTSCVPGRGPLSRVNLIGFLLLLMSTGLRLSAGVAGWIRPYQIILFAGSSAHCHLVISRPTIRVGLRMDVNPLVFWEAELLLGVLELALGRGLAGGLYAWIRLEELQLWMTVLLHVLQ